MGSPRCKWVRDRLPLLAGDDLVGPDRRRVESHLIGCAQCRRHRVALGHALQILQAASASAPARPDAPSLWPDLSRQIRESRRTHRGPTFSFSFSPPRLGFWPAFGLSLGLLAAIGAMAIVRKQIAASRADMVANARPIAAPTAPADIAAGSHDSAPSRDLPTPVAENAPQRLQDDIEHATAAEPREAKPSY